MTTGVSQNTTTATHAMGIMDHVMTTEEDTMTVTDAMAAQRTITAEAKATAMVVDLPTAAITGVGMMIDIVTGIGMMTDIVTEMENQDVLAILMERIEAEDTSPV